MTCELCSVGQHLITALADSEFGYSTTSWWLGEEISFIELGEIWFCYVVCFFSQQFVVINNFLFFLPILYSRHSKNDCRRAKHSRRDCE